MDPREINLIHKFLKMNFGDLEINTQSFPGTEKRNRTDFISLNRNNKRYFINEQNQNITQVNLDLVVRPIVNMFNTDFEETTDVVIEWFLKEYNIDKTKKN